MRESDKIRECPRRLAAAIDHRRKLASLAHTGLEDIARTLSGGGGGGF